MRMVQRFSLAPVGIGCQLWLYSLDTNQMREMTPKIEHHRGPLSYLSLSGIKDIVLQSTGQPMPLLHLQFGPCASGGLFEPQEEHVHMFCTPSQYPLALEMTDCGFEPSATATLLHHRMGDWDWRFVLTSEI